MRMGWVGFHVEGIPALRALVEHGAPLEAVVTLRPEVASRRSGAADYRSVCRRLRLPLHEVDSINSAASIDLLRQLDLDVVFVIGWTQLVQPEVLRLAHIGMIGAHASLLPADRGRAPINWALIRGAQSTGNTLLWLSEGVDAGDVIDQVRIPISPYDTCASLYRRVAMSNREMILRAMPALLAGERPGRAQGESDNPPLPGRRPEDGLVDWTRRSEDVYNFVRAISRPYPGAFSHNGPDRFTIWQCALLPTLLSAATNLRAQPGEVLGPVVSPDPHACGQVVACGDGAIVLLEIQHAAGAVIRGRAVSDLRWTGQVLGRRVGTPVTS
jgi:methionyl-tRNA formyltransferase